MLNLNIEMSEQSIAHPHNNVKLTTSVLDMFGHIISSLKPPEVAGTNLFAKEMLHS